MNRTLEVTSNEPSIVITFSDDYVHINQIKGLKSESIGFYNFGQLPPSEEIKNGANMKSKIGTKLNILWSSQKTPLEVHLGHILGPCWTKLGPKLKKVGVPKRCQKIIQKQMTRVMRQI